MSINSTNKSEGDVEKAVTIQLGEQQAAVAETSAIENEVQPPPGELPPGQLIVRGIVTRVTFRSPTTGFVVMRAELEGAPGQAQRLESSRGQGFRSEAQLGSTTVVGVLPETCGPGTHFIARGEWQNHNRFGKQFRAFSITESPPTGKDAIQRYLGSGSVKGFGPKLAERIVERFGEQAIEILDTDPERLLEVTGIGRRKLDEIKAAWGEKRNLREVILFFQQFGIPIHLAQRIYNAYGERAIEKVRENPYILAREVWGIGFATADSVAQAMGTELNSLGRVVAGLEHSLKKGADDGHCYLPEESLLHRTSSLLGIEENLVLQAGLSAAIDQGMIVNQDSRIYLPQILKAEEEVATALQKRLDNLQSVQPPVRDYIVEQSFLSNLTVGSTSSESSQQNKSVELSPQQQEAVRLAATQRLLVITGGPGCGKTTVVRAIAQMFVRAGLNIKLAAPTGRAAQRLAEVCSLPSSTIHRLLKYDPAARDFQHNGENLLELDALIVDESSMIDIVLASQLLAALPEHMRLVIVGDADQLPSVGPGLFLADLLALSAVPRVRLTTLFRRAEESQITQVAHQVNAGIVPNIPAPDGQTKTDAYFLSVETSEEAAQLVERLVTDQIPKRFGFSGSEIMVLSPMNQGDLGVVGLNSRLQQALIPASGGGPTLAVGDLVFHLGDRVCQRVNNYQLTTAGVFNGDQGEIVGLDQENRELIVKLWDGREVTYPKDCLHQLDLAYAITIHRSQGSEVPVVVLVVHEAHTVLLERQLLYTAVTRAKKLLIIVGTRRALALATKKSRSQRRYTGLATRIDR